MYDCWSRVLGFDFRVRSSFVIWKLSVSMELGSLWCYASESFGPLPLSYMLLSRRNRKKIFLIFYLCTSWLWTIVVCLSSPHTHKHFKELCCHYLSTSRYIKITLLRNNYYVNKKNKGSFFQKCLYIHNTKWWNP